MPGFLACVVGAPRQICELRVRSSFMLGLVVLMALLSLALLFYDTAACLFSCWYSCAAEEFLWTDPELKVFKIFTLVFFNLYVVHLIKTPP